MKMDLADFEQLSKVCHWLNTLPVYMFSGELTAALILYACGRTDMSEVDHAVRVVLNYQASFVEPMEHQKFIETVKLVLSQQPPHELVAFLGRDVTH